MHASATQQAVATRPATQRDWVEWYGELPEVARRELRARLLTASYDEVKEDPELRTYFLFHSEDLADEKAPGADRLAELHHIVGLLRGASEPEQQEKRRKAVAFLLAEYQRFLRDNPWAC
jgi:hypothetical protein